MLPGHLIPGPFVSSERVQIKHLIGVCLNQIASCREKLSLANNLA